MRNLLISAALLVALAGCSTSSKPAAAHVSTPPTERYHDPHYGFSFRLPAGWRVGKGSDTVIGGVKTYLVQISLPGGQSQMEITVDKNLQSYSWIPEGKIANDPSGGPDTFHYHHLKVSSWPSIQIERYSGSVIDEIDTITNTRQYSFDVRMVTGSPPFPPNQVAGYHTVVSSLSLPF